MPSLRPPLLALALALPLSASAQDDCTELDIHSTLFGGASESDWLFGGDAVLTASNGTDPDGSGWLRLTPSTGNRRGAAHNVNAIPTTEGAVFDFEVAAWGGTGADGVSFFLYDGALTNAQFRLGADGGSLGYAQKTGVQGMNGGYLGVGFDEWGNYANPTEGRVGGPGFRTNWVSIRGPQTSYSFLTGAAAGFDLDCTSPTCTSRPPVGSVGRYRARVVLQPVGASYKVSTFVQRVPNEPYVEVIAPYTMPSAPPATVKVGWSGSTGGSTNVHELRDLHVGKPIDLSIAIDDGVTAPQIGDTTTTTITVTNTGELDVCDATLDTLVFPAQLENVTWVCTGADGATCGSGSGSGTLADLTMSLPPGGSVTVVVTATVSLSAEGTYDHTATVEPGPGQLDADPTDNFATDTNTVDPDADGDGIDNGDEIDDGTDPLDSDTDDDGLSDGDETNGTGPLTGLGPTDPNDPDSDDDGIQDGTEVGVTVGTADPGTDLDDFIPDEDGGATTTDPTDDDSDEDGLLDGSEDADSDGAVDPGETDPNDDDSDDDHLQDGTEQGLVDPEGDDTTGHFIPDADGGTTTDPLDDDSDDDGLLDGNEDANHDGATTHTVGGTGTDGSGETDPNVADTDGDGVQDGTEQGLDAPQGDGTGAGFVPDGDSGDTTTDPLDVDTDDGGVDDGAEDTNANGVFEPGEIDPNFGGDDGYVLDSDDDGLSDFQEDTDHDGDVDPGETDPHDADTDDDGLSDGDEVLGTGPLTDWAPTDPLDTDTDDDGLQDGTEVGVTDETATEDTGDTFIPDTDPTTTTDPNDDDSDEDGIMDGTEDTNHNGAVDTTIGGTGTDGAGETDPGDADTDGDGIQDGTEQGLTEPEGDDTGDSFVPDEDPESTTDPLDTDTDDGGASDGLEDPNHDGEIDDGEIDPNEPSDDPTILDCDDDGLSDAQEVLLGTDPCDADTDDDGLSDSDEVNGTGPLADWDPTDPLDADTDDDGIQDGTEVGVTDPGDDTDPTVFQPDEDPSTETDPNNADTDNDGLGDGDEDQNHDGEVDQDESDPLDIDTDDDGLDDGFETDLGLDPTVPGVGQGGAGCDVGGGAASTGPLALLLALAAPFLRRRGGLAMLGALVTGTAYAQDDNGGPRLDIQTFDPTPQSATFTRVRDAEQGDKGAFGAFLSFNYGWEPFEIGDPATGERQIGIIDHLFAFDIGAEYSATDWLAIGATMPVLEVAALPPNGRELAEAFGGTGRSVGIGDLVVQFGLSPVRQKAGQPLNVTFVPRFLIPTGTRKQFLGAGTPGVGADVAVGRRWDPIRFTAMVGYVFIPVSEETLGVYADDQLRYGIGIGVPVDEDVEIELEWNGAWTVGSGGKDALGEDYSAIAHTPMELNLSGLWTPDPVWLKLGAAAGMTRGYGTPNLRVFIVGGFHVGGERRDRDADGIFDMGDKCKEEPEDMDAWQDDDGCPEADNDGDGIVDTADGPVLEAPYEGWTAAAPGWGACMNDAEDKDAFEDEDGCPEPDNDGDGVLDAVDGMRNEDGTIAWLDGFPGIGDCANQAEVFNGVLDDDGCPDTSKARLDWKISEIVVLENIYFKFDKWEIDPASFEVMEAIKAVFVAYPSITKVEIQGHTDERGSAVYNEGLSQKRVDSVRAWLVQNGIDGERLVAKGYGESAPLVPSAKTEAEHAQNRRVTFVIMERAPDAPEVIAPPEPAPEPAPAVEPTPGPRRGPRGR